MYGNYQAVSCFLNPIITETTPADSSLFLHGEIIDLTSKFKVLNNELPSHYSFGWVVVRLTGNIDVTNDIVKTYYNTSMQKVHLD
jgi:hypothetical protein